MSALRLAWPGLALSISFVDDVVAGPILAATGAWVGGQLGVLLGVVAFTAFVGLLVTSALVASRTIEPAMQTRIDTAVASAARRRFVGRYVQHVGDHHLGSTAVLAAAVSPVLAVLLARLVHPTQTMVRTTVVAVAAYGVTFSLFYIGLGAGIVAAI
jgi:hypothetical protein